jgi:hypothetical protein
MDLGLEGKVALITAASNGLGPGRGRGRTVGWAETAAADLVAVGVTLNRALPGYHATDRVVAVAAPQGFRWVSHRFG